MKTIVSISLGPRGDDYAFETEFLGQDFEIRRMGTNGSITKAAKLLQQWDGKAAAIALGGIKIPAAYSVKGTHPRKAATLKALAGNITSPVTLGSALGKVAYEWSLRHLEFTFGDYFNNAKVLFLSGQAHYPIARVMSEFTANLIFADPLLENGIPKFLTSLADFERYARDMHDALRWVPTKTLSESMVPMRMWNQYVLRKAMQKAHVIVVPSFNFYRYLENTTLEELGGKTVITANAYEDRVEYLKSRGVDVIIDAAPKILERVVGLSVLEALIIAALGVEKGRLSDDDLLEIISEQHMDPRVIYPSGREKRINRFAFVIHPLSQEFLKRDKSLDLISQVTPPAFMDAVETVVAYAPPWVYSRVTGIKSPQGVEAEGWLITVGGTPRQMLAHRPEFTYKRLLQAAKMAKRLGAQIMGLGGRSNSSNTSNTTHLASSRIPSCWSSNTNPLEMMSGP